MLQELSKCKVMLEGGRRKEEEENQREKGRVVGEGSQEGGGGGKKEETGREESREHCLSKSTEGERQGKVGEVGKEFTVP